MTAGLIEGSGLIGKWITNKNTLEYLGTWERINNPGFNYPEFGVIEKESRVNRLIWKVRCNRIESRASHFGSVGKISGI